MSKDTIKEIWSIMYLIKTGVQKVFEPIVQSEGINMLQAQILIWIDKGKVSNIGEISKEFGMNQGNLSTMCKNLEKEGLVSRKRATEDERIVNLKLTKKGKTKIENLKKKCMEKKSILNEISKEKLETIKMGLGEIVEVLKTLEKI